MLPDMHTVLWPGWETVRILGQGSFGAVYEIRRDVFGETESAALKVISIPQSSSELDEMYGEGYDDASIQKTLESQLKSIVSEYSLMRKLNGCANVVHCDDVRYEKKPDGIGWNIYIKMELLTPLMKALPLDITEKTVIRIGKEMCNALEACEYYGIIHRDIKPQNMFLNETGNCKLGDFGIAKTIEKTSGGTKIGTFKYMAPEVYNNQPYGAAADIYSLGLVLYWLLNERRMPFVPLPPAPVLAGVDGDAANRRLSGAPIPMPKNGSQALKEIVLKACAFDPKARYHSAEEMRRALENLERAPVVPVAPPAPSAAQKNSLPLEETVAVRHAPQSKTVQQTPPPADMPRDEIPAKKQRKSEKTGLHIFVALFAILAVIGVTVLIVASIKNPMNSPSLTVSRQESFEISAGANHTVALESDGTVVAAGDNYYGQCDVTGWTDIVAVSAGNYHTVGLKANGTVVAMGDNNFGQCDASDWKDIVNISVGGHHTVGLKSDGTVVAVGSSESGQCNVFHWPDVIAISAGQSHTVGLKSNGALAAVGDNRYGQCDVFEWSDIAAVSAGWGHTVGLKTDGTVVAVGNNEDGQCDVSGWTDIVAISAGKWHTVGLKTDGTVVAVGDNIYDQCDVSDWTNIVAISAGDAHTVGVKSDGTVVTAGNNNYGQCNVSDWKDIVAISAGTFHTVGLESDGTVVAVGDKEDRQCDVSGWTDIMTEDPRKKQSV